MKKEMISSCAPGAELDPLNPWCGCGQKIGEPIVSKCLKCQKHCNAYYVKSEDTPAKIYLVRECHACTDVPGTPRITSARIAIDSDYFWSKKPDTECCTNGECSSVMGTNATKGEQLHTCTIVIEIVQGCNLSCPTCYADSPQTTLEHVKPLPIETFKKHILKRLSEQGKIDIIQLSGGEPTLHPQFFEIVAWLAEEKRIDDILLNTNGIRLNDPDFLQQLIKVAPKGRFSVYLQYDGVSEDGQLELRGGDFRSIREKAITAATSAGIPVCLTQVVTHSNLSSIAKTIDRALQDPMIKWVTFQPEFISGRNDYAKLLETPVSVSHIVLSLIEHSNGLVTGKSFMPLPCSHPNCGTIGFLIKQDEVWKPVSDIVDLSNFTELIKDRMNFDIDNAVPEGCGCDDYNLDELLIHYGIAKEDVKMIFIKPFMDVRTWDEERIKSCCTHVMTPEGKLDSFCRYYAERGAIVKPKTTVLV